MTGCAAFVARDVLTDQKAWSVLQALAAADGPVQYSDLRRRLGMHPEHFRRALDRLDSHAMLGRILRGEPNNLGRRQVFLETTAIGTFWAQHWPEAIGRLDAQAVEAGIA